MKQDNALFSCCVAGLTECREVNWMDIKCQIQGILKIGSFINGVHSLILHTTKNYLVGYNIFP